jgi:hypothetical protein
MVLTNQSEGDRMTTTARSRTKAHLTADAALSGILALLVDEREERVKDNKKAAKTEVLLGKAGVPIDNIEALTGKKVDAIRKALQRAK